MLLIIIIIIARLLATCGSQARPAAAPKHVQSALPAPRQAGSASSPSSGGITSQSWRTKPPIINPIPRRKAAAAAGGWDAGLRLSLASGSSCPAAPLASMDQGQGQDPDSRPGRTAAGGEEGETD